MIYIIDASASIYAGALAPRSKHWNNMYFPTGGMYKLFGYVMRDWKKVQEAGEGNVIICFDNKKNYKKEQFPFYKANREGRFEDAQNEIIHAQINASYKYLKQMGFPVLMEPGYEADDIIYSLVLGNKNEDIIVRSDDYDLNDINLFNRKAHVHSITGLDDEKRTRGVTLWSIIFGNTSDNIPALPKPVQGMLMDLYNDGKFNPFKQGDFNDKAKYLLGLGIPKEYIKQTIINMHLVQPKFMNKYLKAPDMNLSEEEMRVVFNILGFKSFLKSYLKEDRTYDHPRVQQGIIELLSTTSNESKEYLRQLEEQHEMSEWNNKQPKRSRSNSNKKLNWDKKETKELKRQEEEPFDNSGEDLDDLLSDLKAGLNIE